MPGRQILAQPSTTIRRPGMPTGDDVPRWTYGTDVRSGICCVPTGAATLIRHEELGMQAVALSNLCDVLGPRRWVTGWSGQQPFRPSSTEALRDIGDH